MNPESRVTAPLLVILFRDPVYRLRKWIVARLASIMDNNQVKKDEELILEIAK